MVSAAHPGADRNDQLPRPGHHRGARATGGRACGAIAAPHKDETMRDAQDDGPIGPGRGDEGVHWGTLCLAEVPALPPVKSDTA